MNELIMNIDNVHTTELGKLRISRNLKLVDEDVVEWCKSKILNKNAQILQQGKTGMCLLTARKLLLIKAVLQL